MAYPFDNTSLEPFEFTTGAEFIFHRNDIRTTQSQSYAVIQLNEGQFDRIIGNYVIFWMEVIVVMILCGVMSLSGLATNSINILVFCSQRALSSSSNVSLLALALADMACLIPLLGNSINYAIYLLNENIMPFLSPRDVTEIFFLWPHIMFTQISSWITVYIAFERCCSVCVPFKVKVMFSAQRTLIIVTTIAVVIALSFVPNFATTRTEKIQNFHTNSTKLIFSLSKDTFVVAEVSNILQSIVLRILAVTIVFICTQITVYRVKISTKVRKILSVANSSTDPISTSETNLELAKSPTTKTITEMEGVDNGTFQGGRGNSVKYSSNTATSITSFTNSTSSRNTTSSTSDALPASRIAVITSTGTKTTRNTTSASKFVRSIPASDAREQRLIRIITMISTIFIVCNAPEIIGIITLIFMQNVYGISSWDNLIHMFTYIQFFFESINASINIFVYYNMSTRYRIKFRRIFRLK